MQDVVSYIVIDDVEYPVVVETPMVSKIGNSINVEPNVLNVCESINSNTTFVRTEEIEGVVNEYMIQFNYNSGNITFDWGSDEITWEGGNAPTWTSGKTYEISILNNLGLWAEF